MCCPRAPKGSGRAGARGRAGRNRQRRAAGALGAARMAIPNDWIEIVEAPARVPAAQRSCPRRVGRVHERRSAWLGCQSATASRCAATTMCTTFAR